MQEFDCNPHLPQTVREYEWKPGRRMNHISQVSPESSWWHHGSLRNYGMSSQTEPNNSFPANAKVFWNWTKTFSTFYGQKNKSRCTLPPPPTLIWSKILNLLQANISLVIAFVARFVLDNQQLSSFLSNLNACPKMASLRNVPNPTTLETQQCAFYLVLLPSNHTSTLRVPVSLGTDLFNPHPLEGIAVSLVEVEVVRANIAVKHREVVVAEHNLPHLGCRCCPQTLLSNQTTPIQVDLDLQVTR